MLSPSLPSRFDEETRAIDHFGEQLAKAGYSYYGSETLYSGASGQLMEAEIFMGVVYYQRLRHMVSDKVTLARPDEFISCCFKTWGEVTERWI